MTERTLDKELEDINNNRNLVPLRIRDVTIEEMHTQVTVAIEGERKGESNIM